MVAVNEETKKALVLVGVFGFLAIGLMIVRLIMRKVRGQSFNWSDYLTMLAIFCMIGRSTLTPIVLLWQNNNISKSYRATHVFTDDEIYQREIGSKLTLVNRVVYNCYIWIQKCVVLLLYHRMLHGLYWPERIMKAYWFIIPATLIPVQATVFSECRPVRLYWQVTPDPGTCSTAVIQLYVLVSLNIFTDIILIILPMPWLLRMKVPLIRRIQLTLLFSLAIALIIIALIRLPIYSSGQNTTQVNRNTLGSIEGFFAAFVANVPTLFTLRKSGGTKSKSNISDRAREGLTSSTKTRDRKGFWYGFSEVRKGMGRRSGGAEKDSARFLEIEDVDIDIEAGSASSSDASTNEKQHHESSEMLTDGIIVTHSIQLTRHEKLISPPPRYPPRTYNPSIIPHSLEQASDESLIGSRSRS